MSSNNSSKGKLTLKDKEEMVTSATMTEYEASDSFAIDPNLIKELKDKNLAYKWINAIKHKASYGFDRRGWQPYKRESKPIGATEAYGYADPEGFVRRSDMILAVRPQALHDRKMAEIRAKSQGNAKDFQKQSASQLKNALKDGGINAKVHEGYDEND